MASFRTFERWAESILSAHVEVDHPGADRDGEPDYHVFGDPLQVLGLALHRRFCQGRDCDFEGGPRQDAGLGARYAVPSDLLYVALRGHQVAYEEDVADVDLEPLLVQRAHDLPHQGGPGGLDAQHLGDLVDVVGVDPRGVDPLHGDDLAEVRAGGLDEPFLPLLHHGHPGDPWNPLELHVQDLVPEGEQHREVRILHVDPDYLPLLDLDLPLRGL